MLCCSISPVRLKKPTAAPLRVAPRFRRPVPPNLSLGPRPSQFTPIARARVRYVCAMCAITCARSFEETPRRAAPCRSKIPSPDASGPLSRSTAVSFHVHCTRSCAPCVRHVCCALSFEETPRRAAPFRDKTPSPDASEPLSRSSTTVPFQVHCTDGAFADGAVVATTCALSCEDKGLSHFDQYLAGSH